MNCFECVFVSCEREGIAIRVSSENEILEEGYLRV